MCSIIYISSDFACFSPKNVDSLRVLQYSLFSPKQCTCFSQLPKNNYSIFDYLAFWRYLAHFTKKCKRLLFKRAYS